MQVKPSWHIIWSMKMARTCEILLGEKLDKVMDKFQPFCSHNIQNFIASFKHNVGTRGPMDNILFLKSKSPYD